MKSFPPFIILLFSITLLKAQPKTDTVIYEYVNLLSGGDTSYLINYFIDDRVLIIKRYHGWSMDLGSITQTSIDTFVVRKNRWEKLFNGKIYPFLSNKDFDRKRTTVEYIRSESPPNLRNHFVPVKKIKLQDDLIYVYDLDVFHGKTKFYSDTRVYFSFKYGLIGYINNDSQMLMNQFVDHIEMELRKRK